MINKANINLFNLNYIKFKFKNLDQINSILKMEEEQVQNYNSDSGEEHVDIDAISDDLNGG
jgi:hypothetical protein